MTQKLKIGVLISGGGSNLQAILDACEAGKIDGEVVFAGSDNPGAPGLERARKKGVATFAVDYRAIIRKRRADPESFRPPKEFDLEDALSRSALFPGGADREKVEAFMLTRAVAEFGLLENMGRYSFDVLALAGFMRNLTPCFIDRVNPKEGLPRIMNIHPAILPAFPGVDGYGDTFRHGCKVGGCTVHFIDYGEDSGPIIGQRAFPILPGDTLDEVKKKGLKLEWELYPECVQLYAQRRLRVAENRWNAPDGVVKKRRVVEILPARE
ncbi:Phosphoribosylglycinamide formyltransferase [Candidatus Desulfarcum epimagneticum]|uniref:Phosphoribosylglycinamide formyltransferase n=1 Tax=uncultured Desulfobacteraceae bacterium TaxID=218296 RepID=A0A484HHM8_9BACT|nr:Phosphoribosylglycinamide formyltransferase [uncultured Desulfobacteraceae bacterium]